MESQSEFSRSARNQPVKVIKSTPPSKPMRPNRTARDNKAGAKRNNNGGYFDGEDEDEDENQYQARGGGGGYRNMGRSRFDDDYDDDEEEEDEYYDRNESYGNEKYNNRDKGRDNRKGNWNDSNQRGYNNDNGRSPNGNRGKANKDKDSTTKRAQQQRDYREEEDDNDEWEAQAGTYKQSPSRGLSSSRSKETAESNYQLDLSDMKRFLTTPLPIEAGTVQCQIRRNVDQFSIGSMLGGSQPTYSLYLKQDDTFLMCSKKRPNNRTSNYLISMEERNLDREGPNYLGKLRSNFIGTEFQVFDNGHNPKDEPESASQVVRKELGGVMYAANVLGSKGPRKMQVCLPPVEDGEIIIPARNSDDELINRIKNRDRLNEAVYLINKPPRWNEQVGAYVLNFQGRVTMASVKNFQLVDPEFQDTVVLQFGKVGKNEFTMDMHHPISPFQAFAVTLSSFDSKIACD